MKRLRLWKRLNQLHATASWDLEKVDQEKTTVGKLEEEGFTWTNSFNNEEILMIIRGKCFP